MDQLTNERKLFRIKVVTLIVALTLIVSTVREFRRFQLYNEKGTRFRFATQSKDSVEGIRTCYILDIFFGIWLITIWKASLETIHIWMVATFVLALLISFNFIYSGLRNGYFPFWQSYLPLAYFLILNRIVSRYWNL